MSLTIVEKSRDKSLGKFAVFADITFDSSYATGGESLLPTQLGLKHIDALIPLGASKYRFEFDHTNYLLMALGGAGPSGKQLLSVSDLKGSANTDHSDADQASLPTNGAAVSAEAAVAAGAYAHGALTSPDVSRNVCIVIHNDSGGALNLYEGAMKFTVTGTLNGVAQTEDITITSTAGNKAVANTKYRYKYGLKPFTTVTNVVVDHVCDDGLKIAAGLGSKIGLPNALATGVEENVLSISKNAAYLAATGIVDTTYNTVNFGTLTDGDDVEVVYAASAEVPAGTDLSSVTTRIIALGI